MKIIDKQNYEDAKPMMNYYKTMLFFYKFAMFSCSYVLISGLFMLNPIIVLTSYLLGVGCGFAHKYTDKTMKNKLKEYNLTVSEYYATKKQLKIEKRLTKIKEKTLRKQEKLDAKHKTEILNYTTKSSANTNINKTLSKCEKILTDFNPDNLKTNTSIIKQMLNKINAKTKTEINDKIEKNNKNDINDKTDDINETHNIDLV